MHRIAELADLRSVVFLKHFWDLLILRTTEAAVAVRHGHLILLDLLCCELILQHWVLLLSLVGLNDVPPRRELGNLLSVHLRL